MTEQKHHAAEEDRLISFEELAGMCGVTYRAILQARTEGRFNLPVVNISPRNPRVRLSDVRAVIRGERALYGPAPMHDEAKARTKAANGKKGGAK
jgi:hypothetical protein